MRRPKRFSVFLSLTLILFVAASLALVIGSLYTSLSKAMAEDFRHRIEVRQVETVMALHDRVDALRDRLRGLATNNTIRVGLMLGVEAQVREILKLKYAPSSGSYFFIRETGKSEFLPPLPNQFSDLKPCLISLNETSEDGPINFQKTKNGHYIAMFSAPIRRRMERLGMAYLVWDLTSDEAFWSHMKLFPHSTLLVLEDNRLVNPSTGQEEIAFNKSEHTLECEDIGERFIMPLKGFPGLFFSVSSSPLKGKKQELLALLLALCAGIFLLTGAVSFVIARRVSHPLENIAAQALEIAKHPDKPNIDEKTISYLEFRNLVRAFNAVLAALVTAREQLKEKAEKKLQESEERYRKTFEASPYSIVISTLTEGRFLEVNEAFLKLSGYSKQEAIGKTALDLDLYADLRSRQILIEKLKIEGEVNNLELDFRRKDGEIITTLLSARRLQYAGQDCVVILSTDITEQKRVQEERKNLEDQLRQAQKMEAIGTLAGGVAHDFRNILQTILAYSEILLLDLKQGEKGLQEIVEIQKAAKRASELTQQLLTFSRKIKSNLRPVDINQVIRQAVKLLTSILPKTIRIDLQLREEVNRVKADPAQIEQVLLNLGINAKDAMPKGGTLVIRTEDIVLDEVYCKSHPGAHPGKYVLLDVTDTGQGMDKETLEHIFEPFYTTKETGKGTGLGLAMVYGIVKNHNGHIMCHSEQGIGTSFNIYLPAISREEEIELVDYVRQSKEEIPMGSGETVLVIDDDEPILAIFHSALQRFNYKVLTASRGKEGLQIYGKAPESIDLIILDYMMPEMDGFEVLKRIHEIDSKAKVMIVSGYAMAMDQEKEARRMIRGFLKKPFNIHEMLRLIRQIIEEA